MKLKYMLAAIVLGCTIMVGCEKDETFDIPEGAILLNAEGFNNGDDKTSVSGIGVQWVDDDIVTINGNQYYVTVEDGHAYVTNNPVPELTPPVTGSYGCTSFTHVSDLNYNVTVPSRYSCTYDDDGRQVIALPMVAYSSSATNSLTFKHVTAAVRVKVKNTLTSAIVVDSVVVSSSNFVLSGTKQIAIAAPTVGTTSGNGKVTVVPTGGLTVPVYNNNASNIREVQVPILPVGENARLIVDVYAHISAQTYHYSKTVTVAGGLSRNVMMPAGCHFDAGSAYFYDANSTPLTFEAMAANCTVSLATVGSDPTVNLQYSTDGSNWITYEVDELIPTPLTLTLTNVGDKVQFRAYGDGNAQMANDRGCNHFTLSGSCYVYGNVMSLLYNDFDEAVSFAVGSSNNFNCLFEGCSTLYSHPTKELVLPATSLTEGCYKYMFNSCSHLERAPALPATVLASGCYYLMFQSCSNLNYIKCLATTNISTSNLYYWVVGVNGSGTFVKDGNTTWPTGDSGIPSGWTVQTASN